MAQTNHTQQAKRLDYINYQINELDKLNPSVIQEEALVNKKDKIVNLEENQQFVSSIEQLFDSEYGLNSTLSRLEKEISATNYLSSSTIEKVSSSKRCSK